MKTLKKMYNRIFCSTQFEKISTVTYYDSNTGSIRGEVITVSEESPQPCASPLVLTRSIRRSIKKISVGEKRGI